MDRADSRWRLDRLDAIPMAQRALVQGRPTTPTPEKPRRLEPTELSSDGRAPLHAFRRVSEDVWPQLVPTNAGRLLHG